MTEGLTYRFRRFHDSNVHVLTVNLLLRTIRPIPVGPDYPAYHYYTETTRPPQLALAAGALASVGSDYSATRYAGVPLVSQPIGAFALNGEVWTTGQRNEGMFVVKQGRALLTGATLELAMGAQSGTYFIDDMNVKPKTYPAAYTARGGMNSRPDWTLWHAWLSPTTDAGTRVVSLEPPYEPGGIIVENPEPMDLAEGEEVWWAHNINGDPDFHHIISGNPIIVKDGVNTVKNGDLIAMPPPGPDNWFIRENPRTCLGLSEDNRIAYLVAVEGRTDESAGLRLKELATLMLRIGAHTAMNLDGGGSTHMWTKEDGLVADSCYGNGTLEGTRPQAYATAVF